MTPDDMKREAARAALTHVESGMRLGLGHGTTAKHFVDLLGEIVPTAEGRPQFSRGVTHYPVAGTPVRAATDADLTVVYTRPSATNVSIGTLYHDPRRSASIVVDELLAKNFAVLGPPGPGNRAQ